MEAFNAEYVALMRKYGIQSVADMPALYTDAPTYTNAPQAFAPALAPAAPSFPALSQYFVPAQDTAASEFSTIAPMPQARKPTSSAVRVKAPTNGFFPPTPGFTPEAPSFEYPTGKTAPAASVSPMRATTPTSHMSSGNSAWATPEQLAAVAKFNDGATKSKGYIKENAVPRSAVRANASSSQQLKTMPVTNFQPPAHMLKSTASFKPTATGLGAGIVKPASKAVTITAPPAAASPSLPVSTITSNKAEGSNASTKAVSAKNTVDNATAALVTPTGPAIDPQTPVSMTAESVIEDVKSSAGIPLSPAPKWKKRFDELIGANKAVASTADTAPATKVAKLSGAVKPIVEDIKHTKDTNGDHSIVPISVGNGATLVKTDTEAVSESSTHENVVTDNDAAVTTMVANLTARIDKLTDLWAPDVLPEIQSILSCIVKYLPAVSKHTSTVLINGNAAVGYHGSATATDKAEVVVDDIVLKVKYPDGSIESVGTNSAMRIGEVLERVIAKKPALQEASFDDVSLIYVGLELDHLSTVGDSNLLDGHTVRFRYTKA